MPRAWQLALFELRIVRAVVGLLFLCRGTCYSLVGCKFRAMTDFCWVGRVSNIGVLRRIALRIVFGTIETIRRQGRNVVLDSFRADRKSSELAATYAISGGGSRDLFRDLIVLKKYTPTEKGVVLLKYARTFSAVAALLDLPRIMERYVLVLEPCWSGYCDPSVLMFVTPGNPVIVQCFTDADYDFIASVGSPLVPVRLGPADWVNAEIFAPQATTKSYDLVMVANWAAHKRHAQLFRALRDVRDRDIRVLLVGFPWADRTAEDIRREAAKYENDRVQIEIVENVPQTQLAEYVARCKAFVFLSRKEGDNKAVVEAMFSDVPAIVYDATVGGAGSRINAATGVFASDEQLAERIVYVLDHYQEFSPREWALKNTGSKIATGILNEAVGKAVAEIGGAYTHPIIEKTNAPNLAYKDPARRSEFTADYEYIVSCLSIPSRQKIDRAFVRDDLVA